MSEYDDHTLALAAEILCSHPKATASKIREELKKVGIDVGKHSPFNRLVPELIDRQWLKLSTPSAHALAAEIKNRFRDLEDVTVTSTSHLDHIASHTAYKIRDLLTEQANSKDNVHIGFSGGHTTRRVFQELVHLLVEPGYELPKTKTIFCHALVAGFDNEAPGTDPSSFFTYLDDHPTPFINKRFFLLHAPAFVPAKDLQTVFDFSAVKEAAEAARRLNLIVTSAASFKDKHSQLRKYYEKHDELTFRNLENAGCLGDILWLPIDERGPMDLSDLTDRPVTLLQLQHLPDRIGDGIKVLLIVGPCADPDHPCGVSKAPLLSSVLSLQANSGRKYITHLVVDGGTARELIEITAAKENAA